MFSLFKTQEGLMGLFKAYESWSTSFASCVIQEWILIPDAAAKWMTFVYPSSISDLPTELKLIDIS